MLEKLKGEADRERTSLYLSKSLMESFKEACGGISPSRVMEDLMRDFVEIKALQEKADNMVTSHKANELEKIKKNRESERAGKP